MKWDITPRRRKKSLTSLIAVALSIELKGQRKHCGSNCGNVNEKGATGCEHKRQNKQSLTTGGTETTHLITNDLPTELTAEVIFFFQIFFSVSCGLPFSY